MKPLTIIEKLNEFVDQNPNIEYKDSHSYNAQVQEAKHCRNDYFELLALFLLRYGDRAELALIKQMLMIDDNFNLKFVDDKFVYKENGGIWSQEYRRSACHLLAQLILNHFADESLMGGWQPIEVVHKAIESRVSNRVYKLYFK